MKIKRRANDKPELVETWPLPYAATLGSSVRAKGLFLEARARLPEGAKRSLTFTSTELALRMPADVEREFRTASDVVSEVLHGAANLPVIPREIQDILAITTTERHRWLKDGRLPSAGTRTVKLRGRAKKITFHVFDPRLVEDMLDRDLVTNWREEDAATAVENRRRAAWKAKITRSLKADGEAKAGSEPSPEDDTGSKLLGWAEFARNGLLR